MFSDDDIRNMYHSVFDGQSIRKVFKDYCLHSIDSSHTAGVKKRPMRRVINDQIYARNYRVNDRMPSRAASACTHVRNGRHVRW